MKLQIDNIHAIAIELGDDEREWLDDVLSWPDPRASRPGYRGDGLIHAYDFVARKFSAGFTRVVMEAANRDGVEFKIRDVRSRPCWHDAAANIAWLRDYQHEAMILAEARTRGVLHMPTGSGKTEVAAALGVRLPCRWLFLVHRTTLAEQAADRFKLRTGEEPGVIGEGSWDVRRWTAATFQTIYSRMKRRAAGAEDPELDSLISGTEGFIVDECHVLPAESFARVAGQLRNAFFRIGVSGTPLLRGDHKSQNVIGVCGPVLYRVPAEKLISEGVLSRPKIRMVECRQSIVFGPMARNRRQMGKLWAKAQRELIVESIPRNRVILEMARRAEKPCLVFIQQLAHGKALEQALRIGGLKVEMVAGKNNVEQRKASIVRLERGDVDVLVASVVFNEGVDIPELRSVVIAGGGQSAIAALQRVGRGMRVVDGKDGFEVWDVADVGTLLEKHAKARRRAYGIEGYSVEIAAETPAPTACAASPH